MLQDALITAIIAQTPLTYSHSLDYCKSFNVTSHIGRDFLDLQLEGLLSDDANVIDLGILYESVGGMCTRSADNETE